MAIAEHAPAKINLALHLRRRRADGYHDLETVFAFARHGDRVTVELADEPAFDVTGPFAAALAEAGAGAGAGTGAGDNLVLRAEQAFAARFAPDAVHAIHLEKNLPVASGIGGGSADAAATLRALAHLHGIGDRPALLEIARALGADVPACFEGRTAFGEGRGDALRPLPPLGDVPALLVNPGVAVSTAAVFAGWDGNAGAPLDPADWRTGRNDLEAPARRLAPAIDTVLAVLAAQPGATMARMSGSGATCFALFGTIADRDAADRAIAAAHPDWWRLATTIA